MKQLAVLFAISLLTLQGADKKELIGRGANQNMEVTARVFAGKDAVKAVVGDDLGGFIYVVELTVKPRTEEGVRIDRDEFVILTTDDGQRAAPFAPSQLSNSGGLTIVSKPGTNVGVQGQQNGPVWGGIGGGMPRRMPGNGGSMGNGSPNGGNTSSAQAETREGGKQDDALKKVLEAKELPQKQVKDTTTGYLYFPVDGKHKVKNIMLLYRGTAGRIDIEFKN